MKSKDTLYSIAKKYNTTVEELKTLNNLTSNTLSIGQRLIVPTETQEEGIYIVKSGDTLYKIANNFNLSVADIINANNLETNLLSIGQRLIIPKNKDMTDEKNEYIVKKGDTLYSIAKDYNTTVNELMQINNLTSNLLSIGQRLIVPTVTESNLYIVEKGDTLYSIARRFGKTVLDIQEKNNLNGTILSIGQKLII